MKSCKFFVRRSTSTTSGAPSLVRKGKLLQVPQDFLVTFNVVGRRSHFLLGGGVQRLRTSFQKEKKGYTVMWDVGRKDCVSW